MPIRGGDVQEPREGIREAEGIVWVSGRFEGRRDRRITIWNILRYRSEQNGMKGEDNLKNLPRKNVVVDVGCAVRGEESDSCQWWSVCDRV